MAVSGSNQQRMGAKLELLNTQQKVTQARRELDHNRKLEQRGFVPKYELQRSDRRLRDLERAYEIAKEKVRVLESATSNRDTTLGNKADQASDK